jgi:putative PIN family toxin of toxin-antitoxin system
VDTNVLISAFAFGGTPAEALRLVIHKTQPWISLALLQEYREVPQELLAQGKITRVQFQALLSGIASFVVQARLVRPRKRLLICRDPEDNIVLECCHAAQARFLITGDRDLLELPSHALHKASLRRLQILTPRAFLEMLQP